MVKTSRHHTFFYLIDHRSRLLKKCKELKAAKLIKDVVTDGEGSIEITMKTNGPNMTAEEMERINTLTVVTDADYENLVRATKKNELDEEEV